MRIPQEIPILPISINLDLSFKENVEGTLENFRDAIYTNAINLAGDYDPAFAYKYNYMVKYSGELYICIMDCTGIAPGNVTYWDKVTDKGKSLEWKGAYDNAIAYQILDLVFYNNNVHICIQNSTGHNPSDANYWRLLSQGIVFKGAYSASTTYYPNDIVTYEGSSYASILETLNHIPTNTTYWILLAQKGSDGAGGDMFKSVYDADNDGHIDELVTHLAERANIKYFGAHSVDEIGYENFDSTVAIQAAV
ncbi:MAG TPA: hypothetical protein VMV86_06435, partial [Methanosarcinales archaeon]|nr:hypothetical protein [Methanosarcinales archaeon]